MLFNSYFFLLLFLPVVFFIFHGLVSFGRVNIVLVWLTAASFFFYSYWNPPFVLLLSFSVTANFFLARLMSTKISCARIILILGVVMNLSLIVYFKYANFIIGSFSSIMNRSWINRDIFLPLGISFFTFQQIAFLVEIYRKEITEPKFLHYALFVSFFPQLIAGPIVRYTEIVPSFLDPGFLKKNYGNMVIGIFLFSIGLAKKVIIADTLSPWVSGVFDGKSELSCLAAWSGVLAYTFQIYFDFSGYSDMAMGLGKLFNINIPVNFRSPYKAISITEFWRRWHITLSSFLKDYLYIPMGGNRNGVFGQYRNLLVTMTLGGLWHGASWTFVFWGAYHGILLLVHKMIIKATAFLNWKIRVPKPLSWLFTFFSVIVGWVFFRSDSIAHAFSILSAMAIPECSVNIGAISTWHFPYLFLCLLVCLFAPSGVEMAKITAEGLWEKGTAKTIFAACLFIISVSLIGSKPTEFLYFQF